MGQSLRLLRVVAAAIGIVMSEARNDTLIYYCMQFVNKDNLNKSK